MKRIFFGCLLASFTAQAQVYRLNPHTRSDFADPSAPVIEGDQLKVYMTAGEVLSWKLPTHDELSIPQVLISKKAKHEQLKVCHSNGKVLNFEAGEDAWDPTVHNDVLYAGVMTPQGRKAFARWPEDNWSRRTYPFRWNGNCWVMAKLPLWGERPKNVSWLGHNYGHDFIEVDGTAYVFYERVTDDSHGQPWRTEIFARKMETTERASETEIPIYGEDWPSTKRDSGGHLLEGPRVFKAGGKFLISFSAGEYASDEYGIHLLWSDHIEGPYQPYLNSKKTDLKDFGEELEKTMPMTWGAGRAVFFESQDRWWALFHGIRKGHDNPDMRSLYLSPVELTPTKGAPRIRLKKSSFNVP